MEPHYSNYPAWKILSSRGTYGLKISIICANNRRLRDSPLSRVWSHIRYLANICKKQATSPHLDGITSPELRSRPEKRCRMRIKILLCRVAWNINTGECIGVKTSGATIFFSYPEKLGYFWATTKLPWIRMSMCGNDPHDNWK